MSSSRPNRAYTHAVLPRAAKKLSTVATHCSGGSEKSERIAVREVGKSVVAAIATTPDSSIVDEPGSRRPFQRAKSHKLRCARSSTEGTISRGSS